MLPKPVTVLMSVAHGTTKGHIDAQGLSLAMLVSCHQGHANLGGLHCHMEAGCYLGLGMLLLVMSGFVVQQ